jgi:hypothetical protein
MDFESFRKAGVSLGSGALLICDQNTCIVDLVKVLLQFFRFESAANAPPAASAPNAPMRLSTASRRDRANWKNWINCSTWPTKWNAPQTAAWGRPPPSRSATCSSTSAPKSKPTSAWASARPAFARWSQPEATHLKNPFLNILEKEGKLMINLTITEKIEVPEGMTVLQAAEQAGITIPTLCDHPDLTPTAAAACAWWSEGLAHADGVLHPARQRGHGWIRTALPLRNRAKPSSNFYVQLSRQRLREWTKRRNPVYALGQSLRSGREKAWRPCRAHRQQRRQPFVWVDMNKCILCTAACAPAPMFRAASSGAWPSAASTPIPSPAPTPTMLDARCESCGACVAYCPTGALDNKMSMGAGKPDKLVIAPPVPTAAWAASSS